MFSRFNYKPSDYFYNNEINTHMKSGTEIYQKYENQSKDCLNHFILENGYIDGTSIKDHWFDIQNVDVFISHSHKDLNKVKAFAGWLKDTFGLTSFIDSCVWGYCNDLLKQIDDNNCKNKHSDTYNYELRNYTTSHVHMMLSIALSEMIDKTECILFFNTPNSVSLKNDLEEISENGTTITTSPWIYHELAMTTLIRQLKRNRPHVILEHAFEQRCISEFNSIDIEYDVDKYLEKLISINDNDLTVWKNKYNILTHKIDGDTIPNVSGYESTHPLDVLYYIKKAQI